MHWLLWGATPQDQVRCEWLWVGGGRQRGQKGGGAGGEHDVGGNAGGMCVWLREQGMRVQGVVVEGAGRVCHDMSWHGSVLLCLHCQLM
jgi:hypothetical protein